MRNDYAIHCAVVKRKVEEIPQSFSNRLTGRRVALGLSQAELARRAGISLRSVQNYEGREAYPTGRTLRALCAALEIPLAYLMDGKSDAAECAPPVAVPLREDRAAVYRARSDRIVTRLSELTDLEFARTEPAIFSLIEAVVGSRPPPGINSGEAVNPAIQTRPLMEKELMDQTEPRSSGVAPTSAASTRATPNTGQDSVRSTPAHPQRPSGSKLHP